MTDEEIVEKFLQDLRLLPQKAVDFSRKIFEETFPLSKKNIANGEAVVLYLTLILGSEILCTFSINMLEEIGFSRDKIMHMRARFQEHLLEGSSTFDVGSFLFSNEKLN